MSITGSLSNALSGLTAAAKGAEVISANVANALTEGYGQRDLTLGANSLGGNGAGVSVIGIHRSVDIQTISERRIAQASTGRDTAVAEFLRDVENSIGSPEDPGSLTGQISHLEASLLEAASRPDSETRLAAVLTAAEDISHHFNSISNKIQSFRMDADREISRQVSALNQGLEKIASLNNSIQSQISAGHDASAIMDQRQTLIDSLSSIVPIRQVTRDNGKIALFTPNGAILLDGKPAEISFSPAGVIVPEMSVGSGALSGLSLNGQPLSSISDGSLSGGSLAGLFAVRDEHSTSVQQQLDAVARDLIERFTNSSVDPTLATSDPGLFTDRGGAFSVITEVGLSGRISVNPLVIPSAGGALWKLRDGIGAALPGSVGDATLLQALVTTLTENRVPGSGGFAGSARSAAGLSGAFLSLINTKLQSAEADQSFSMAKFDALKTTELQGGVDTDEQMQRLLLVEQAYAANAKVIMTIDQMIQTILGL